MKKIVLLFSLMLSLYSCSDDKQLTSNIDNETGYAAYLKSNPDLAKTSTLNLDNSTFDLDYVRDQRYYNTTDFCYGYLYTDASNFADILSRVVSGYSFNTVWEIALLSSGVDLCDEQTINRSNIKFVLVYYKGANNIAKMDYINLTTNAKETYTIGEVRFSVAAYFLMKKSGITSYPSLTTIKNRDFNYPGVILDDNNDYVARITGPVQPENPGLMDPGFGGGPGGPDCPGDCPYGNIDDCANFFNGSCTYTFDDCPLDAATKSLYNSSQHQQLSNNLFSKYSILYTFRDNFLTKTNKGKRYLIDYYTLGELQRSRDANDMSLSQMVTLANLIINNSDKFVKLINHTNNSNVVLYTASEANTYKSFLTSLRSLSTHTKWTAIMNMVENDITANQGKTVSQVVAGMN